MLYANSDYFRAVLKEFNDGSGNTGETDEDDEIEDMGDETGEEDTGTEDGGVPSDTEDGSDDVGDMEDVEPEGEADPAMASEPPMEDGSDEVGDMDDASMDGEADPASEDMGDDMGDDGSDEVGDMDDVAADNEGDGSDELDGGDGMDDDVEDMGDDPGDGEGEGGMDSSDPYGSDGTGEAPDPHAAIKDLESQIYDTLSPEEKAERDTALKRQFLAIITDMDQILQSISDAPKTDVTLGPLDTCGNSATQIKVYATDYVNKLYDKRPYTTNLVTYEKFLAAIAGVRQMIEITLKLKIADDKKEEK